LKASSETVREWALRTMGERGIRGLPAAELLAVATNRNERLFARGLAVRVIGREAMDGATAETLLALIDQSDDVDFQRIIMEALGSGARSLPTVGERLARYLNSPHAAIQHEAFSTLRETDTRGKLLPEDYARGSEAGRSDRRERGGRGEEGTGTSAQARARVSAMHRFAEPGISNQPTRRSASAAGGHCIRRSLYF
jgi:hypothetical protein